MYPQVTAAFTGECLMRPRRRRTQSTAPPEAREHDPPDTARASGCSVLADEAFIDYIPDAAVTRDAAARPGVIAIRSLTKFLGCPGLRVGYAVAAPETMRSLTAQLPAWPVTTLALNALAEALEDTEFARQTIETNHRFAFMKAPRIVPVGQRP